MNCSYSFSFVEDCTKLNGFGIINRLDKASRLRLQISPTARIPYLGRSWDKQLSTTTPLSRTFDSCGLLLNAEDLLASILGIVRYLGRLRVDPFGIEHHFEGRSQVAGQLKSTSINRRDDAE